MAYRIRLFREEDADALAALTRAAIETIGARRYSPAQVAAWAARHPGPGRFLESAAAGHLIWVAATEEDEAIAYALLEPDGHLDMLHCHPDHTRKGLADRLLAEAERHARETGAQRLYTEASELARPAFERAGYRVTHRRDLVLDGVAIHNFAMEKVLDS